MQIKKSAILYIYYYRKATSHHLNSHILQFYIHPKKCHDKPLYIFMCQPILSYHVKFEPNHDKLKLPRHGHLSEHFDSKQDKPRKLSWKCNDAVNNEELQLQPAQNFQL